MLNRLVDIVSRSEMSTGRHDLYQTKLSPGTVKLREEGSLRTLVGGALTVLSVLLYFSLLSTVYNQMM